MQSHFLVKYLVSYFNEYKKPILGLKQNDEAAQEARRDPRYASLTKVEMAATEGAGGLTRIFNRFPAALEVKTDLETVSLTPFDPVVIYQLTKECRTAIGLLYKLNVYGVAVAEREAIVQNFLNKMIAATIHEILNDQGELYPQIKNILNLHHKDPNLVKMTLISYINEIVFADIQARIINEPGFKLIESQFTQLGVLVHTLLMANNGEYVQQQIDDHIFRSKPLVQHCVDELKNEAIDQRTAIKTADIRMAPTKEFQTKRSQFWREIEAMFPDAADAELKNNTLTSTKAISKLLNVRDNQFIIDNLLKQISGLFPLSVKDGIVYQQLLNLRISSDRVKPPGMLLMPLYSRCAMAATSKLRPLLQQSLEMVGIKLAVVPYAPVITTTKGPVRAP